MAAGRTVERYDIDGPHGQIELRGHHPAVPSGVGLMWVHGGGFVSGSLDMASSDWVAAQLRATAGVPVEVITEPGTTHGHINNLDDPAASRTVARMAAWLTAPAPERFVAARLGGSEVAS